MLSELEAFHEKATVRKGIIFRENRKIDSIKIKIGADSITSDGPKFG
jgi:hypothetical protein